MNHLGLTTLAMGDSSTTDWAAIVNAALNTVQTIALAFIAARWRSQAK